MVLVAIKIRDQAFEFPQGHGGWKAVCTDMSSNFREFNANRIFGLDRPPRLPHPARNLCLNCTWYARSSMSSLEDDFELSFWGL